MFAFTKQSSQLVGIASLVAAMIVLTLSGSALAAGEKDSIFELTTASEKTLCELTAAFGQEERFKSAILELDYWFDSHIPFFHSPSRKTVKTKDGKVVQLVFLSAPAMSMPGTDFSMAVLLVDGQAIDWASCWTCNRIAMQELMLEDVDRDGFMDVAFEAKEGCWGLGDKRQHICPGDPRKWLYAYRVTSTGFQSLFPPTERLLNLKVTYDTSDQPVRLSVTGLPKTLRERRLVECTVYVTNTSKNELKLGNDKWLGRWFDCEVDQGGFFMQFGGADAPPTLKPSESTSCVVKIFIDAAQDEDVTLKWRYVPAKVASQ